MEGHPMNAAEKSRGAEARLPKLLDFLKQDPNNTTLLADAAVTALDEGAPEQAMRLLDQYAAIKPLSPALLNLSALAAMALGRFDTAAETIEGLLAEHPDDAVLKLNLAWARASAGQSEAALSALDDAATGADVRAAVLKVKMLHKLGRLEDALACGLGFAELFGDDAALMGALSEVAVDERDLELAASFAARAGDNPEGLSTQGVLLLGDDQVANALAAFDRVLALQAGNPRALLGKGLSLLASNEPRAAAGFIDRAAQIFGDHIGSWVAAGWTWFILGDLVASRARFEKALALDDAFAETQGGLACLDVVAGDLESGKRRTEIALRLDRNCLGGALAKSLLLAREGDAAAAERVRAIAINVPLAPGGRSIAQAMAALGMGGKPRSD
jgi:tetratricopeptide (TPR) repeat protein